MSGAIRGVRAGHFVLVAEPDHALARQAHALEQVIEHHDAAERRRQRRDQHAVVAARQHAGDRARRVAAEAVGHEPLAPRWALARRHRFVFPVARRDNRCVSTPSSRLRHEKQRRAPWHQPRAVGIERRRALAAIRRRLAAPHHSPSRPDGGASSGSRAGVKSRSQPRFTTAGDPPCDRVKIAQQQRPRAEHRAFRPVRPRAREHRIVAPQREQIAVQRVGLGVALAFAPNRASQRSKVVALRRRRQHRARPRSSVRLGNCARNSTRPWSTAVGEVGLVIGEIQERARRRELLSLEQHRRRRARAASSAVSARCAPGLATLVQPLPERRVRHLIVVLEKRDERVRRQIERRRAAALLLPGVPLALIEVAEPRARHELLRACPGSRDSTPRGVRSAPPSRCDASRRSTARRRHSRRDPARARSPCPAARFRRR